MNIGSASAAPSPYPLPLGGEEGIPYFTEKFGHAVHTGSLSLVSLVRERVG